MLSSSESPSTGASPPHGVDLKLFFQTFYAVKGAVSALVISTLYTFAIGCTVAVVPEVLGERYARLYHGYDQEMSCSAYEDADMPEACRQGADAAQAASAWSSLLLNVLTLFCTPVIASISDARGRRPIVVISMLLSTLAPMVLVLLQWIPTMNPTWYYVALALVGVISYLSIIFAALSDSISKELRAPSFALIMAGTYSGFSFSPSLALCFTHLQVSMISALLMGLGFLIAVICFPETLPNDVAVRNRTSRGIEQVEGETATRIQTSLFETVVAFVTKPFREMNILKRSRTMKLVATGSFFSAMVFSLDANLVIYFIEEHLNVREKDIAQMFILLGTVGLVFQAGLLQPLIACLGEKGLLVLSFCSGTLHNFLYGAAHNKRTIYVALAFSQLTKTNYPILASFASKGASVDEQGQVQGALFGLNAVAAAMGPLMMQTIYDWTKDSFLGPGTMFFFASLLYFVGTIAVSRLPPPTNTEDGEIRENHLGTSCEDTNNDLEQPLLASEESITSG